MGQLLDVAIYLSGFGSKCDCHQSVCQQYPDEHKVFRLLECAERLLAIEVGSKRFGQCLGQIYAQRSRPNYHYLSANLDLAYFEHNDLMREKYAERFIDMLTPVRTGTESVRVFSNNNKIISQDTEHLTQNGAKYYAKLLENTISALLETVSKNSE